jgi:glyoxylase-like metal-dependent hydrolase (beta-lactamase superfamily II)
MTKPASADQHFDYPQRTPPAPGATLEIAPGVHWLRMPLPFALDHINLWLLEDGDGWTIVDCGIGNDVTRGLWEEVFAARLDGKPVKRVIVTHYHPDHAGLAGWLTKKFSVPLVMAQAEYMMAHLIHDGLGGTSQEALLELFRRNGLDEERITQLASRGNHYARNVPDFPVGFTRIMDGDVVTIDGRGWRMIAGYGHSPEHAALYCESRGVMISGDMVLPRISTNVGVWGMNPEGNPLKQFLDSLGRYLELPASTLTLPSHGLPFRSTHERIAQLREHHRLRLAELQEACREPKAASEVLTTLFRRELDIHQTFFAMGEAMAHLHYLLAEGRVTREAGAGGVLRYRSV